MINHLNYDSDYGEIILDSAEPFAKKILEHFTSKATLEILELTQNPRTICEICARSSYSKATLYRRISNLLDCCLLFAVKKENNNCQKYGSWMYAKSFYAISVRSGQTSVDSDCQDTIIEILSKRKFYGQILKTIRNCR